MARDDARVVAAFTKLNLIRTDRWPLIASWLLASGLEGNSLLTMAALDRQATPWDADPLVPDLMREIGSPAADNNEAALLLGATYARAEPEGVARHTVIRVLARAAPQLDYPAGWLSDCYHAEEFLDCDCDPEGDTRADHLEQMLRTSISVEITAGLARALIDRP